VFKKHLPKDDNEDRKTDHILRILRAYEGVTTNMMIRASWEKADFSYLQRDGTFYLAVGEGRIRVAPDFCEIWERNYPIESLSVQRRIRKGMGEPVILRREICEAIERKPNRRNNLQFIKEFDEHLRRES
jgi:hypothetical protein